MIVEEYGTFQLCLKVQQLRVALKLLWVGGSLTIWLTRRFASPVTIKYQRCEINIAEVVDANLSRISRKLIVSFNFTFFYFKGMKQSLCSYKVKATLAL